MEIGRRWGQAFARPQGRVFQVKVLAGKDSFRRNGLSANALLRTAFDQSMTLLSLIELNRGVKPVGSSKARDQCLEVAGIRTIRLKMRKLPLEAAIHAEVCDRNAAAVPLAGQAGGPAKIDFWRLGSSWKEAINIRD